MSLTTKISVESDTASPWLARVQGNLSAHRIAAEIGPRGTRLVQRNFRKLGGNAMGWPSTHFYGRAAEATNWQEGSGFVMISVNQIGIRQRLMGGPIRPVNAGALTIPAQPDAYGKTAREFQDLEFAMVLDPASGRMRAALVEKKGTVKKSRGSKGEGRSESTGLVALFWLAKGVRQEPNPNVMPSDQEFEAEFDKSVEALMGDEGGGLRTEGGG